MPEGFAGVSSAAALIFFAYIGFDAISTSGEETRKPQRDMPIAILGALLVATCSTSSSRSPRRRAALHGARGLRGAAGRRARQGRRHLLGRDADRDRRADRDHLRRADGALRPDADHVRDVAGRPRPEKLARCSKRQTPVFITVVFAGLIAIIAAFVPLTDDRRAGQHRHAVRLLPREHRRAGAAAEPARPRARLQRAVRAGLFPIIGAALCVYLMTELPVDTWLRFIVWMAIGLLIYFVYGRRHSKLRNGTLGRRRAVLAGDARVRAGVAGAAAGRGRAAVPGARPPSRARGRAGRAGRGGARTYVSGGRGPRRTLAHCRP